MEREERDVTAWFAISSTRGIGPAATLRIMRGLRDRNMCAGDLLDERTDSITTLMIEIGASEKSAAAIGEALSSATSPNRPDRATIVHPDRPEYPRMTIDRRRPLPAILYASGATHLLSQPGVAVVGSRDATPADVDLTRNVARGLAIMGLNVVSGHARGIDHAAHSGAIEAGGTTTAVLAEGIEHFKPRDGVMGDAHSSLVVSQFPPGARWRGHQAMARNGTVAALSRAVVAIASGPEGGTREMIALCRRTGLPVVGVKGRVPDSVASDLSALADNDTEAVLSALREMLEQDAEDLTLF